MGEALPTGQLAAPPELETRETMITPKPALLLSDLDTPSVAILLDRLEQNIARVQNLIASRGLGNRPHIKTHKIPAIAKMQIEAGAIGITCQKLGEAEEFVAAGVDGDILLTYTLLEMQN